MTMLVQVTGPKKRLGRSLRAKGGAGLCTERSLPVGRDAPTRPVGPDPRLGADMRTRAECTRRTPGLHLAALDLCAGESCCG